MIGTGRTWAILRLAFLLAQTLPSATSPSPSSSSAVSNSADQGHHDDHDHHHDHAHYDHDHAHDHDHEHGHGCRHVHHGAHTHQDHDHHHHHQFSPADSAHTRTHKLPEELAEEEELRIYGFKSDLHVGEMHHHKHALPSIGLWMRALGCSLLVSMASLICLIILPLIVAQGKPSRVVVDFLAAFGAGAMLGDAFLHQLPHALGGSSGHSHSHGAGHDHNHGHSHQHDDGLGHSHTGGHGHAHSIQDLSVGLAVLAGIILFFIVEKIVRHVEKASSKGTLPWVYHHHHHHHHHPQHDHDGDKQHQEEDDEKEKGEKQAILSKDDIRTEDTFETITSDSLEHKQHNTDKPYRRKKMAGIQEESETTTLLPEEDSEKKSNVAVIEQEEAPNLVLGYLNLFSDGVHNFTDGMALGAAFLNHGTLGGWSRTLFLLAHELPQEVGDFGILVQSGFTVLKALAFNFLSALAALVGTAVALLLGGNPGHSSLIEGFTAGGFIYIAVAGVLPEMHQHGTSTKTTCLQLVALSLGMSVALSISLVE